MARTQNNIILYGLKKFLIRGESQDRSYRQGRIEIVSRGHGGWRS